VCIEGRVRVPVDINLTLLYNRFTTSSLSTMSEGARTPSSEDDGTVTPKDWQMYFFQYMVVLLIDDHGYRPGESKRDELYWKFLNVLGNFDIDTNEEWRMRDFTALEEKLEITRGEITKDTIDCDGKRTKIQLAKLFWDIIVIEELAGSVEAVHVFATGKPVDPDKGVDKEIQGEYDAAKLRLNATLADRTIREHLPDLMKTVMKPDGSGKKAFENVKRDLARLSTDDVPVIKKIMEKWSKRADKEPWMDKLDENSRNKYLQEFIELAKYFRLDWGWATRKVLMPLARNKALREEQEAYSKRNNSPASNKEPEPTLEQIMQEQRRRQAILVDEINEDLAFGNKWSRYGNEFGPTRPWETPTQARKLYKRWIDAEPMKI
jgi:hypothetical protein